MAVSIMGNKLLANVACFVALLAYTLFGGFTFLYFEHDHSKKIRNEILEKKHECILATLLRYRNQSEFTVDDGEALRINVAQEVAEHCLIGIKNPADFRRGEEWNIRNSLLYGFGILTTLGYGKIEPETISARMFAVVWGFFGVPFTVVILTNLGLYLRKVERFVRRVVRGKLRRFRRWYKITRANFRWRSMSEAWIPRQVLEDDDDIGDANDICSINQIPVPSVLELELAEHEDKQISPFMMAFIVSIYLAIGAVFLPLLRGNFSFVDGLFYSYLCFTAIEYGHLIPESDHLIPFVLLYMFIGLAMSTIALDIGSNYVRRLYYLGKRAKGIAEARFFYGANRVSVRHLFFAVGQAIGVTVENLNRVNLDKMVDDAILVKEGQMDEVPQNYAFMEGIWPPELIPLFQRDGNFPEWVDADPARSSVKSSSTIYNKQLESIPAFSLSTYENGRLHRSLYSTGTGSTGETTATESSAKDRNNNPINENNNNIII